MGARGHHADIGGATPGSMPPDSTCIDEEGALLDALMLVDGGVLRDGEVRAALLKGPWPARDVERNFADLRAQLASVARGTTELTALIDRYGTDTVLAYVGHVQDNAEECVRRVIAKLSDGRFAVEMDDRAVVRVAITVDKARRTAQIDFTVRQNSGRAIPTRLSPWPRRPCSTLSAPWWTMRFRSTRVVSSRWN